MILSMDILQGMWIPTMDVGIPGIPKKNTGTWINRMIDL
jgi:hypothetical protein